MMDIYSRNASGRIWRAGIGVLAAILSIGLSGCINIVPVPRMGEVEEAKTLARSLKLLAPQARQELGKEHTVAVELKITLDESAQLPPNAFREKFNAYVDQLVAIRNKRREILETVRQGLWQSPMVFVIQQDALTLLRHEIARTEGWIELAKSIRLRVELGRQRDFPELPVLTHQLDTFLAETGEDPLGNQLRALLEEFRLGEAEVGG